MNTEFEMVRDARKRKGGTAPPFPVNMLDNRQISWTSLIVGESFEFLSSDSVAKQAGSILRMIHLCLDALVEMGVEPDGLFQIIHDADVGDWWNGRVKSESKPDYKTAAEEAIYEVLVKRTTDYVESKADGQEELPFT